MAQETVKPGFELFSRRTRLAAALLVAGTGFALFTLAVFFSFLSGVASQPDGSGFEGTAYQVISSFSALWALILGLVIVWKTDPNRYGWIWLSLGFFFGAVLPFTTTYSYYTLIHAPGALPGGWLAASLGGFAWLFGLSAMPFVLLLFPTGRLPSPAWRWIGRGTAAAIGLAALTGWSFGTESILPLPNPRAPVGPLVEYARMVATAAVFAIFAAIPLSALSLIARYRQANALVRLQLMWFALGGLVFVLFLLSDFFYTAPGLWEPLKEAAGFGVLPLVVTVAMLRYRLYDIQVIIRRTLQYTVLSGLLALIYFGSVVLLQNLLEAAGGRQSPIVIVLSTLFIAALFSPLRRRVQAFIDRRFYRRKYDAQQVLTQFAAVARDEVDIDRLASALTDVIRGTMQPEQAAIWLRKGEK